jgi:hypothetical protein
MRQNPARVSGTLLGRLGQSLRSVEFKDQEMHHFQQETEEIRRFRQMYYEQCWAGIILAWTELPFGRSPYVEQNHKRTDTVDLPGIIQGLSAEISRTMLDRRTSSL